MIMVDCTPNYAGIEVKGDFADFEALYEALHSVIGDEDENIGYEGPRLRILSVCYDLRHAMMGDREVTFVDNGMDEDKMKIMALVAPDRNLYYSFKIYFPEALFVWIVLNDFVKWYARKQAKREPFPLLDKRNLWDPTIVHIRVFQSEIAKCVRETVTDSSYSRMLNLMFKGYSWLDDYVTQYLDILNIRFLKMDGEERQKKLPLIAKRIAEQGKEYQQVRQDVLAVAQEHNCSPMDVQLIEEYPEEIEW